MEIYKRVVAQTFLTGIPEEFAEWSLKLANLFVDWLLSQCDVVVRQEPQILKIPNSNKVQLAFRIGLMERFDPNSKGMLWKSNKAFEEFVKFEGPYLKPLEE